MIKSPITSPNNLTEEVKMTTTEFNKLREAVIEKFGNDSKFREWQRGKFIKLSYGDGSQYRERKFND